MNVTIQGQTYTLTLLFNGRLYVFQRGSGLQGSMSRTGRDAPSWLDSNTSAMLAASWARHVRLSTEVSV